MKPLAPRRDEFLGLRGRIIIEHGRLIHIPMYKPHGVAVFQIDSGVKYHGYGLSLLGLPFAPAPCGMQPTQRHG